MVEAPAHVNRPEVAESVNKDVVIVVDEEAEALKAIREAAKKRLALLTGVKLI